MPQQFLPKLVLAALTDTDGDLTNDLFRKLAARPTVSAGVAGARAAFQSHQQYSHPDNGRDTGAMFILEQDLRQESPQGYGRREYGVLVFCKRGVLIVERLLDRIFRKDVGERKIRAL